jgi:hypothetical protein
LLPAASLANKLLLDAVFVFACTATFVLYLMVISSGRGGYWIKDSRTFPI